MEETIKQIPTVISQTIDVLSLKFGATTEKLLEIMVRGKFAESLSYTTIGLITLITGLIAFKICYDQRDTDNEGIQVISTIVGITGVTIGTGIIATYIVGVFAPDYVLIMSLIK